MGKNDEAPIMEAQEVTEAKEPTLAEKVKGVENQLVQAMLEAAMPILEENGFTGFKDVSLVTTRPDEDGNVQQTIRVLL